jgi:hypothetical protein
MNELVTLETIVITAGRNILTEPMNERDWSNLHDSIEDLLLLSRAVVYTNRALGIGEYEGMKEESVTYVAQVASPYVATIQLELGTIARLFKQDSIFLGRIGESVFCS